MTDAPEEMLGVAERGVRAIRALGADQAEVYLWTARSWEAREAGGLRTIQEADESGVSVRVNVGGRRASSTTTGTSDEAVMWAARRAVTLAGLRPQNATPWLLPSPDDRTLRPPTNAHPALARPDPERMLGVVDLAGDAVRDANGIDYVSAALVTHQGRFVVANTSGVLTWDQNAHEAFAGEVRGAHEGEARTKRVSIQERRPIDFDRDVRASFEAAIALATEREAKIPLDRPRPGA